MLVRRDSTYEDIVDANVGRLMEPKLVHANIVECSARPLALHLYVLGAAALGVSAVFGGIALMRNPTDDPLGMPNEWLDDTPFRDYFIPGFTLFGVFGIGSFAVIAGVFHRHSWAWVAAVGLGLAQVVWIVVEIAFLRAVHPLHLVYGGLGAALVALATRPSVRYYLAD